MSTIAYTVSLTITRAVRLFDHDETLEAAAEWMQSPEAKRELEREIGRALKKLDGDVDLEVLDATVDSQAEVP